MLVHDGIDVLLGFLLCCWLSLRVGVWVWRLPLCVCGWVPGVAVVLAVCGVDAVRLPRVGHELWSMAVVGHLVLHGQVSVVCLWVWWWGSVCVAWRLWVCVCLPVCLCWVLVAVRHSGPLVCAPLRC